MPSCFITSATTAGNNSSQLFSFATPSMSADIDGVAKENNWDELLPAVVADVMKHEGKYVAAPVNVHRVNWMWSNPEVFRAAGATIPTTWDDFMVQA